MLSRDASKAAQALTIFSVKSIFFVVYDFLHGLGRVAGSNIAGNGIVKLSISLVKIDGRVINQSDVLLDVAIAQNPWLPNAHIDLICDARINQRFRQHRIVRAPGSGARPHVAHGLAGRPDIIVSVPSRVDDFGRIRLDHVESVANFRLQYFFDFALGDVVHGSALVNILKSIHQGLLTEPRDPSHDVVSVLGSSKPLAMSKESCWSHRTANLLSVVACNAPLLLHRNFSIFSYTGCTKLLHPRSIAVPTFHGLKKRLALLLVEGIEKLRRDPELAKRYGLAGGKAASQELLQSG